MRDPSQSPQFAPAVHSIRRFESCMLQKQYFVWLNEPRFLYRNAENCSFETFPQLIIQYCADIIVVYKDSCCSFSSHNHSTVLQVQQSFSSLGTSLIYRLGSDTMPYSLLNRNAILWWLYLSVGSEINQMETKGNKKSSSYIEHQQK